MSYANNAIFVSTKEQVPQQDHWAVFEFSTTTIPGDERSRTHPGHGYPEHEVSHVGYRAYLNREDWEAEIKKREASDSPYDKHYVAVRVSKPATTKTTISVEE